MYRTLVLISWFMLTLVACQSQPLSESANREHLTVGSILTLHRQLSIDPYSARVYLQHGQRVSVNSVSRVHPNCWFEVNDVTDKPQFIDPGRFRIVGLNHYRRPFGLGSVNERLLVAGLYVGGLFDRSQEIEFITAMKLNAEEGGTEIRNFMCKVTSDSMGRYLTLREIREALGEVATIESEQ
jgi:hypothetical protein